MRPPSCAGRLRASSQQPADGHGKPKILVQLDSDPQPSVFDGVVAIDAGAEHLLRHSMASSRAMCEIWFTVRSLPGVATAWPARPCSSAVPRLRPAKNFSRRRENVLWADAGLGHARLQRGQHHGRRCRACRRASTWNSRAPRPWSWQRRDRLVHASCDCWHRPARRSAWLRAI